WLMMSLWDALRMNMMISYQELVRTFLNVKSNNANNWYLTIIDDHGNYISDKI
ncbi:fimbrial protein, partial [Escherichia coli]|uniref:fimbrial protein n=1 Tax=Escherichia coli TaxID=562 RepID=UPI001FF1958E